MFAVSMASSFLVWALRLNFDCIENHVHIYAASGRIVKRIQYGGPLELIDCYAQAIASVRRFPNEPFDSFEEAAR